MSAQLQLPVSGSHSQIICEFVLTNDPRSAWTAAAPETVTIAARAESNTFAFFMISIPVTTCVLAGHSNTQSSPIYVNLDKGWNPCNLLYISSLEFHYI